MQLALNSLKNASLLIMLDIAVQRLRDARVKLMPIIICSNI